LIELAFIRVWSTVKAWGMSFHRKCRYSVR